jgi:hypothetical protein
MAFGIVLYDDDRRIAAIDDAAAGLFAKVAFELVGRFITDFVPTPDREQMAEARATFERLGEAAGQYALEREDGSRESIVYRVLANAPLARLNLMAMARSQGDSDLGRVRRVGDDVHAGLEIGQDERWFGAGPVRVPTPPAPLAGMSPNVIAGVFPTEQDAWAALLAAQNIAGARLEIALSSFDGGWPRDQRSVLAARGADGHVDALTAIIAEFGGATMASSGAPLAP